MTSKWTRFWQWSRRHRVGRRVIGGAGLVAMVALYPRYDSQMKLSFKIAMVLTGSILGIGWRVMIWRHWCRRKGGKNA